MLKNILKSKIFSLGLTLLIPTIIVSGCNATSFNLGNWNNPFYPKAELFVASVTGTGTTGVGILQSINLDTNIVTYQYNEPNVTIRNLPGLPRVTIKQVVVSYNVESIKIEGVKFPVTIEVPAGGTFTGQIPIMKSGNDFRKAAFPNDTETPILAGTADVVLAGIDDHGYPVTVKFSTSIGTSTTVTGTRPNTNPQPSASSGGTNLANVAAAQGAGR
ncbi:MAG: hypothetical protein ACK4IX_13435 [Candidatus Sericytochromatia bacterium]